MGSPELDDVFQNFGETFQIVKMFVVKTTITGEHMPGQNVETLNNHDNMTGKCQSFAWLKTGSSITVKRTR